MDNLKRQFFLKNEFKQLIPKSLKKSKTIPYSRRYQASYHLTTLPRISTRTVLVNRCVVSGRVWSTNKQTNYSRFVLRNESYTANIPGCGKASW